MTAAAVMTLVEKGGIDLLTPLSEILPEYAHMNRWEEDGAVPCERPILIRDLLNMTSGICYPGMEEHLTGAEALSVPVVTDGPVTTARGVGAAIDFALELIRLLNGEEKAVAVKEEVVYPYGC